MNLSALVALAGILATACGDRTSKPADNQPPPPRAEIEVRPPPPPLRASLNATKKSPADRAEVTYTVKLETTKGDILIDVFEDWAPKAAARFRDIVASGYYDGVAFHRVLEAYLAQAGVNGDPEKNAAWQNRPLEKDPLRQNNKCGTVTFAKEGPNGLSTQFFINLKDNHQFDDQGLPPFGKVRHLQVTDNLDYSHSHGIRPDPVRIMKEGVSYLKRDYPKMDYINKATIITAPNPSPKTPAKDPGSPTDVPPSRKGDSQAQ